MGTMRAKEFEITREAFALLDDDPRYLYAQVQGMIVSDGEWTPRELAAYAETTIEAKVRGVPCSIGVTPPSGAILALDPRGYCESEYAGGYAFVVALYRRFARDVPSDDDWREWIAGGGGRVGRPPLAEFRLFGITGADEAKKFADAVLSPYLYVGDGMFGTLLTRKTEETFVSTLLACADRDRPVEYSVEATPRRLYVDIREGGKTSARLTWSESDVYRTMRQIDLREKAIEAEKKIIKKADEMRKGEGRERPARPGRQSPRW